MPHPLERLKLERARKKTELLRQIGTYKDPGKDYPDNGFLSDKARERLHQNTNKFSNKTQREAFIKLVLSDEIQDKPGLTERERNQRIAKNNGDPGAATITLEELLGKDGVELFKKALEEERRSLEFMDAAFLDATFNQEGDKWLKCIAVPIGGVSSSGKTFARDDTLEKASSMVKQKTPRNPSDPYKNTVVAIDGGGIREISQIRKLVIQLAIQKGYTGISDLSDYCGELESVKKDIFDTVRTHNKTKTPDKKLLHLAMPNTFVSDTGKEIKHKLYMDKEPMHKELMNDDNVQVISARIRGKGKGFPAAIKVAGDNRAWYTDFKPKDASVDELDLNKDAPTESKAYSAGFYGASFMAGDKASQRVEQLILDQNKKRYPGEPPDAIQIIYDRGLFKEERPGSNIWRPAKEGGEGVKLFSKRMFREWDKLPRKDRQSLKDFDKYWGKERTVIKTYQETEAESVTGNQLSAIEKLLNAKKPLTQKELQKIIKKAYPKPKHKRQFPISEENQAICDTLGISLYSPAKTDAEQKGFDNHPIWLVLKTMYPVDDARNFNAMRKIHAYKDLADAIQDGCIFETAKYTKMPNIQRKAFEVVKAHPDPRVLTVFKDLFGPESNTNLYIKDKIIEHKTYKKTQKKLGKIMVNADEINAFEKSLIPAAPKKNTRKTQQHFKQRLQEHRKEHESPYEFTEETSPLNTLQARGISTLESDFDLPVSSDISNGCYRKHTMFQDGDPLGHFSETVAETVKLSLTEFPKDESNAAKAAYALRAAGTLLKNLNECPSPESPLILSGENNEELIWLASALEKIGEEGKVINFPKDAICINRITWQGNNESQIQQAFNTYQSLDEWIDEVDEHVSNNLNSLISN
jgi:hypothetical protein